MKKFRHYALLLFTVMAVFGCSKDDDNTDPTSNVKVEKVEIAPTTLDLIAEEEKALTVTITPSDANQNVTWTSSNEAVATVKGGTVKGVAQGETTITVTTEDGGLTATCKVTVTEQTNGYPWYIAGKESGSFEISTLKELKELGLLVNGDSEALTINNESAAVTFSEKTITLKNNINLNDEEWTPIGLNGKPFQGTFDGNGKTISGLKISSSKEFYVGLFGIVKSGSIKNLDVSGGNVLGSILAAGGIAGYMEDSAIENCSSSTTASGVTAGGIVGYVAGCTIRACHATGNISATENKGNANTGGVVGFLTSTLGNNSKMQACYYTTGTVTGNQTTDNMGSNAGGVVGNADKAAELYNCYSTGTVIAGAGKNDKAGGVIGNAKNNTTNGSLLYVTGKGASCGIGDIPTDDTSKIKSIASESDLSANINFLNTGLPGEVGYQFKANGTLEKVQ